MTSLRVLVRSPCLATRSPRLAAGFSTLFSNDGPPVAPTSSYVARPPPQLSLRSMNPIKAGQQSKEMESKLYRLSVQSTRNNTIISFGESVGNKLFSVSGGSCGFKKVNRSGYEAGYQCAVKSFAKVLEAQGRLGTFGVEIFFKGFGQGRDAVYKALISSEGDNMRPLVKRITDRTPLKIGGTKSKKTRRL